MKRFTTELQRKYLRIPFKDGKKTFAGCDCGGLVWLIYKEELDIELPDWMSLYAGTTLSHKDEMEETVSTMLGENGIEVPLHEVRDFDVIALKIAGAPIHVACAVNSEYFIHAAQGNNPTMARFVEPKWNKRIAGVYRHSKML